jgi:hypothetical protein
MAVVLAGHCISSEATENDCVRSADAFGRYSVVKLAVPGGRQSTHGLANQAKPEGLLDS